MKKLEDITYRHELIERYLDADTSVEEEQALADFYRHCEDKDLTEEDLDIRNMMLGMENYTPNFHQTEVEMMEELDRKEEADKQPDMKEMPLGVSKKHETRWVRLSAILLATAMLAGLIFLLFPIKDYFHPLPNNQASPTWFLQSRWFARSHLLKMKTRIWTHTKRWNVPTPSSLQPPRIS